MATQREVQFETRTAKHVRLMCEIVQRCLVVYYRLYALKKYPVKVTP